MSKFSLVAMGGTFDIIHKGHRVLLSNAFSISDKIIIGLTSDELAQRRGKILTNKYGQRYKNLTAVISKEFPGCAYQINRLDDDFGPAVLEFGVEALVVSDETSSQGDVLNEIRAEKRLPLVKIITVPMFLAEDGTRISSTRIRNSEIDAEGTIIN